LEAAEGNLAGTTNCRKTIEFFFGNVVTRDNHFRNGVLFEDFLYGIDRSKDWITIHLLTLVSKIIIDKANRFQIQVGIIKKLPEGINPASSHSIDQNISPLEMIPRCIKMLKNAERTPCPNHKKEKKIEINNQCGPAGDTKAWDEPEKKCEGHTSNNDGSYHSHEIINICVSPGPSIEVGKVKDHNLRCKDQRDGRQVIIFYTGEVTFKAKPKGKVIREENNPHIHENPEESSIDHGCVEKGKERAVAQDLNLAIA